MNAPMPLMMTQASQTLLSHSHALSAFCCVPLYLI